MNIPADYAEVFERIDGVVGGSNNRWDAFCPAHEDGKRSLSIKIGDNGSLLVKCHAPHACSLDAIVKALGVKIKHLFNNNSSKGKPVSNFVKAYDYHDEKGNILYQVVRWEPKRFSQRRPNPNFDPKEARSAEKNPEFIGNIEGVIRTIYRLPDFLQAIKANPSRWFFIMEGEKDVCRAWSNGIVATTNSGGAGKWEPRFAQYFKGLKVAIIPDDDPVDASTGFSAGIRHAESVASSLVGVASVVKIVKLPGLPPKGDFSDWMDAEEKKHGDKINAIKKDLSDLVNAAADFAPGSVAHAPTPAASPPPEAEKPAKEASKPADAPKAASDAPKGDASGLSASALKFAHYFDKTLMDIEPAGGASEWFGEFRSSYLTVEKSFLENVGTDKAEGFVEQVRFMAFMMLANLEPISRMGR